MGYISEKYLMHIDEQNFKNLYINQTMIIIIL